MRKININGENRVVTEVQRPTSEVWNSLTFSVKRGLCILVRRRSYHISSRQAECPMLQGCAMLHPPMLQGCARNSMTHTGNQDAECCWAWSANFCERTGCVDVINSRPHGMGRKCHREQKLLALLCVVLSVLVLVLVVALVVVQLQSRSSHPQFSHVCPDTWIGFHSKCYYFSENETNWNTSLEKCKALEASLTSIDSLEELAFIKSYNGQRNHWFGLHEESNGQWRWTNGTAFNNGFEVLGGGPCAYLNQEKISSALCHTEKYWICSRPNNYVLWRQKIYPE